MSKKSSRYLNKMTVSIFESRTKVRSDNIRVIASCWVSAQTKTAGKCCGAWILCKVHASYIHRMLLSLLFPFFFLLALPCLLLLSMLLKIKWNLFCIIWLAKVLDTRKSYDTTLRNVEISHELHKNFIGFNLFSCKKTKKTGFFSLFYKGA